MRVHVLASAVGQTLRCCVLSQAAFCAGPLVQALLHCGAHNYVEFQMLQSKCDLMHSAASQYLMCYRPAAAVALQQNEASVF